MCDFEMNYILIHLNTFSGSEPALSTNLIRNGQFIITKKEVENISSAQALADMCKSHDIQPLIKKLNEIFEMIINMVTEELENIKQNQNVESIKKVLVICREFELAYIGPSDIYNAGLYGLIETYKNDALASQLENTIMLIKEFIDFSYYTLKNLKYDKLDITDLIEQLSQRSKTKESSEEYFSDED